MSGGSMWPDRLIVAGLQEHRGASGIYPIAYVPPERREEFGPIDASQVQPASLDVRLDGHFIRHPDGRQYSIGAEYTFDLQPGECVLANLVERVALPDNLVARVEGKSTWARKFLTVHSAGFIDPGFHGDITLELKNDGHQIIRLQPGVRIAQISFQWLAAPAIRPYGSEDIGSHYQGQTGATEAWS